ncbi:MAG: peptidase S10 [Rhodanobacter sp.]
MNRVLAVATALLICGTTFAATPATPKSGDATAPFTPSQTTSTGSVSIAGHRIDYQAVAGTLVVHAKGWDETAAKSDGDAAKKNPDATASMFYTAYFKRQANASRRPITFLFNGGPGSSTVWLRMGSFGPVRVLTHDHTHTPAAPYSVVNNEQSLLDASDLVFIDAPGTGFSRIAGKEKEKAFYGVDQDIHAFSEFIREFLSKYNRWNSPKYVFGESYGTMRGAGLALALQHEDIDLNGVILLSNILNWDLMPDNPGLNPAIDAPYIVSLPTYAATAWYHHKIPDPPKDLRPFLDQVERFATTDYALALMRGSSLDPAAREAIAEKLHAFTGLPVAYLLKANLRIAYGAFQKEILADQDETTGTLDTRFTGPSLDPLSKIAHYDPQSAAISSAYVAAWNGYVRNTLNYGAGKHYQTGIDIYASWDYKHQPPGASKPLIMLPNVLPDLAVAMKQNPDLKVMVNGGYFDVSTPYFEGWYEMHHMAIPPALQQNIEYHYYQSGHMVYVHLPTLQQLRDNIADFISRTDNVK